MTPDQIESAARCAISQTREQYARGHFDSDELERRLSAIMGQRGPDVRQSVLSTTEWVEVTALGDPIPRYLPTSWRWPNDG